MQLQDNKIGKFTKITQSLESIPISRAVADIEHYYSTTRTDYREALEALWGGYLVRMPWGWYCTDLVKLRRKSIRYGLKAYRRS